MSKSSELPAFVEVTPESPAPGVHPAAQLPPSQFCGVYPFVTRRSSMFQPQYTWEESDVSFHRTRKFALPAAHAVTS